MLRRHGLTFASGNLPTSTARHSRPALPDTLAHARLSTPPKCRNDRAGKIFPSWVVAFSFCVVRRDSLSGVRFPHEQRKCPGLGIEVLGCKACQGNALAAEAGV